MKTIPEQTSNHLVHSDQHNLKLDVGAVCFFLLGMFLAALMVHMIGWF